MSKTKKAKEEKLALPVSGYEVIAKILHAYSLMGDKKAKLDDVTSKSGVDRTIVSANHGFLASLGLISGGNVKSLTAEGKQLSLAIGNEFEDEIAKEWGRALGRNPSTQSVIDMVKVRQTVPKAEMPRRVASALKITLTSKAKTGVNCLIEIFEKAGLVHESAGTYRPTTRPSAEERQPSTAATKKTESTAAAVDTRQAETIAMEKLAIPVGAPTVPSLHIDVQIHISADAKPEQIDQVFASMAKHLYKKG